MGKAQKNAQGGLREIFITFRILKTSEGATYSLEKPKLIENSHKRLDSAENSKGALSQAFAEVIILRLRHRTGGRLLGKRAF